MPISEVKARLRGKIIVRLKQTTITTITTTGIFLDKDVWSPHPPSKVNVSN